MLASDRCSVHPAVLAWRELGYLGARPSCIITLQEKTKGAVYLMRDLVPGGPSIVAKRSPIEKALVENAIHEDVLPRMSIPGLAYFGFQAAADDTAWLFIEFAVGERYSPLDQGHRRLAAHWLAELHLSSAGSGVSGQLPNKSPAASFELLIRSLDRMRLGYENDALPASDREALMNWLARLEDLRADWQYIQAVLGESPEVVVHGDFAKKNMLVDVYRDRLLVFDWGTSGWGSPAFDLPQNEQCDDYWAGPDLNVYREKVGERWPSLDPERLGLLAAAGKVVRTLTAIHGDAKALSTPWASGVMHKFPAYMDHLDSGLAAIGFPRARPAHSGRGRNVSWVRRQT